MLSVFVLVRVMVVVAVVMFTSNVVNEYIFQTGKTLRQEPSYSEFRNQGEKRYPNSDTYFRKAGEIQKKSKGARSKDIFPRF